MKVVARAGDNGGCGQYRIMRPVAAAAAQGIDVTLHQGSLDAAFWNDRATGQPVGHSVDLEADVFVMQRPMTAEWVEAIPALQRQGTAVVVEIDDDFHAIPRDNQCYPDAQREWLSREEALDYVRPLLHGVTDRQALERLAGFPSRTWEHGDKNLSYYRIPDGISARHKGHLMRACKQADLVTVTTPALADRYGKHGRVAVIPNCVPESYLTVEGEANDPPIIGWTGQVGTHPGDLEICEDAIARACADTGAVWRSVGSDKPARVLGIRTAQDQVPFCPFDEYAAMTAQLDVGIVPLAAHPFNEAKSWLKGLEYAALGVPFVASPTGPYRKLHREGAGVLAHGSTRWHESVAALLSSVEARAELAGRGREVAARWTIEGNVHLWAEAWEKAMRYRQQRCGVAA